MGLCTKAGIGIDELKAAKGMCLDEGHIVCGYVHAVIKGGFNVFGTYLRHGMGLGGKCLHLSMFGESDPKC